MAHIHFIGGEKGGVGKSLVARVLAQCLIDRNLPFLGFDTGRSHGGANALASRSRGGRRVSG